MQYGKVEICGINTSELKVLGEKGYEVKKVRACDMFPQGGHVESVVLLTKAQN